MPDRRRTERRRQLARPRRVVTPQIFTRIIDVPRSAAQRRAGIGLADQPLADQKRAVARPLQAIEVRRRPQPALGDGDGALAAGCARA